MNEPAEPRPEPRPDLKPESEPESEPESGRGDLISVSFHMSSVVIIVDYIAKLYVADLKMTAIYMMLVDKIKNDDEKGDDDD